MPLVSAREVLAGARRGGYAVGAFNANNLEYVVGIARAAQRERSPVIIQASQGAIEYAGLEYITAMAKAASAAPVPVVLHLDHGRDPVTVERCIRAGFSSVMFDGSDRDLHENVALTRRVVEMARPNGIPVEGELGRVPSAGEGLTAEEIAAMMTDPDEAAEFVRETGVDALAVSVGSVHQMGRQEVDLDTDRVRRIAEKVRLPLVLHGSSGVSDRSLREAVRAGICKVNIATMLNIAFMKALRAELAARPDQVDPRRVLGPAMEALSAVVGERMRVLGCSGKA